LYTKILLAEATRRTDCVETLRLILVAAVDWLPQDAKVLYHLARYEVLLGDLDAVKAQLKQTFALDPRLRARALEDHGLESLWDSMGE
jgi:hypothetical protein